MFKLVIQDDEGKTTVVPLIRDEITIGRKEGNTIRLTERNVSRRHARILRNQGEVHIEDLGSYNGIRVNNSRIAERVSLRVSDQVQIGDYKLYLKAEGTEQVDDARTMPIERVDALNGATEVMPAVPAVGTQPPAAPASATPTVPSAPQLVGNPARTLVAIADTDPQGRPVASAATVAALSSTPSYGKLCIVSSNFAGKEFELTRPQMIIGRTPENDIQIDHRSISRNHAKLTREPDSGRYTISDLQSSNGVRVNEQDYGKVELRRGDLVDLGHVRLRFVEPGEDFLFSRDAQISDVSETGGKKGLLVAIVLGVVVLGAVAAFFLFKNSGKDDKEAVDKSGSGHSEIGSNNGTDVAIVTPPPQVTPDAAEAVTPTVSTDPQVTQLLTKCTQLKSDKKWGELQTCANELTKHDAEKAKSLLDTASHENRAAIDADKVRDAIKANNLHLAQTHLGKINPDSVYYDEAKTATDKFEGKLTDEARARLQTQADQHNCKNFDKVAADYKQQGVTLPSDIRCEAQVAITPPDHPIEHPVEHPKPPDTHKDPGNGSATVVTPPPQTACDVDTLKTKGEAALSNGDYASAIGVFRAAYKCKPEVSTLLRAYLASCKSSRADEAKAFFKQLPPSQQQSAQILQICLNMGIDVRTK